MSKMDNLRAMREAKYAAAQRAAGTAKPATRSAASKPPAAPKAKAPASKKTAPSATPSATTDELCGHRNMSGRTCTREKGHAAKSHRYS
ncbi:hypothetical protein NODU109028_16820 [Nocardioides dubius]|uniref:Uncharacterized protein n=1 Tax=Nocardioides dubius TaxID=317019 RepID=A0ABN1TWJ3_9ACTN